MNGTKRHRLTVDISEEQARELNKYFEFGDQKMVFGVIVDQLLEMFKRYGYGNVIGAMLTRKAELKDILKLKNLKGGDELGND